MINLKKLIEVTILFYVILLLGIIFFDITFYLSSTLENIASALYWFIESLIFSVVFILIRQKLTMSKLSLGIVVGLALWIITYGHSIINLINNYGATLLVTNAVSLITFIILGFWLLFLTDRIYFKKI
ncbi:MAG: hypothetical protein WC675_05430 [Patescibacteria group bacterium]|jgi:hypothetical protein